MPEPLPSRTDPGPHDAPADGGSPNVGAHHERQPVHRGRHRRPRLSSGFGAAVLIGLPVTLALWAAIAWLVARF